MCSKFPGTTLSIQNRKVNLSMGFLLGRSTVLNDTFFSWKLADSCFELYHVRTSCPEENGAFDTRDVLALCSACRIMMHKWQSLKDAAWTHHELDGVDSINVPDHSSQEYRWRWALEDSWKKCVYRYRTASSGTAFAKRIARWWLLLPKFISTFGGNNQSERYKSAFLYVVS